MPKVATATHAPNRCWPELSDLLTKRGLTAADLSRTSSIPYCSISYALLGYRRPTERLIGLVAAALHVSPETITPRTRRGDRHAAE